MVLGTLAAIGLRRIDGRLRMLVTGLFLAPMIVPVIVTAVALYRSALDVGLSGTILGMSLGHAILALPFVVINVGIALRAVDDNWLRAAAGLGASPWRIFRTVTLPNITPGIVGGAIFAFITSFDEVIIAVFMAGYASKTLPVKIWESIRLEFTPVHRGRRDGDDRTRHHPVRAGAGIQPPNWQPQNREPEPMTQSVVHTGQSLRLTGVSKSYGSFRALEPTDLDVAAGEFLTLLGPSGSGKTTLLNLTAGYVEPTAGEIRIGERDVTRLPARHRNIGMVFQNYALFPHMSVGENVAYGLSVRRLPKPEIARRVGEILSLMRLDGFADRAVQQMSGGQQQRVALARALVIEPDVLLMDEPLGALDKQLRRSVQLELRRLHQKLGRTTIYVTHDQEEALVLSDRIAGDGRWPHPATRNGRRSLRPSRECLRRRLHRRIQPVASARPLGIRRPGVRRCRGLPQDDRRRRGTRHRSGRAGAALAPARTCRARSQTVRASPPRSSR